MVRRLIVAVATLLLSAAGSVAQQPASPLPLFPPPPPGSFQSEPPPSSFQAEPLPPLAPGPEMPRPPDQRPPGPGMLDAGPRPGIAPPAEPPAVGPPPSAGSPPAGSPAAPAAARVFCDQPVTIRIADRDRVPERYRGFVGMWSDAAWTPQLCAALVVEDVAPDGTARIVYAFGPMGSPRGVGVRPSGGVLHGTGVIRDGELRFQNSDGSQFAFRTIYSDLDGRLTTPQGQSHQAIFKKTL